MGNRTTDEAIAGNLQIRPMDETYIHVRCLHGGPVDPSTPADGWKAESAVDLPPHPWHDDVLRELAGKYRSLNHGGGAACREFMREMIQRYGSCAILAWQDGKVIGQLRFYPLEIMRLLEQATPECELDIFWSTRQFDPAPDALWVQCVMTTRPYFASAASASLSLVKPGKGPDVVVEPSGERRFRTAEEAGARRGLGQKLVHGLIEWARPHGWKRILKLAHADLDYMYGEYGGGGKAFWEKAGFRVTGSQRQETPKDESWRGTVEAQAREKGMSVDEAWTWHRMTYDL